MGGFQDLFPDGRPVIGCVHLKPLPGSPDYDGNLDGIFETAVEETRIYVRHSLDGVIVENFGDAPFFPDPVPAETIAAMAAVTREISRSTEIPVGVNTLRNDAAAAMAIATAAGARFIRVNVHIGAVLTDQGIIEGKAYRTLRLRAALRSPVLILADAGVKHAASLGDRSLEDEIHDLESRGGADGVIVTGPATGRAVALADLELARQTTALPILAGSGVSEANLAEVYPKVDGLIVGSAFKREGRAHNRVEESRVAALMELVSKLKYSLS